MKTSILSFRNKFFTLVIDEPGVARKEKAAVARLLLHEGLGVWNVEDVRLMKHGQVSRYFSVGADHYWSHWDAPTPEKAREARALLRECLPAKDELDCEVTWCTFEGIVRGRKPSEMGLESHFQTDFPVLHTRKEGMALLKQIAEFWANSGLSETDLDVRAKASAIKIENPWRQPRDMLVRAQVDHPELPILAQFNAK